jgi:hypothetical protein
MYEATSAAAAVSFWRIGVVEAIDHLCSDWNKEDTKLKKKEGKRRAWKEIIMRQDSERQ